MVKVRHILPAKMLEIVFAMANITITDKQEVMCGLSINIFASDLDPFDLENKGEEHRRFG